MGRRDGNGLKRARRRFAEAFTLGDLGPKSLLKEVRPLKDGNLVTLKAGGLDLTFRAIVAMPRRESWRPWGGGSSRPAAIWSNRE